MKYNYTSILFFMVLLFLSSSVDAQSREAKTNKLPQYFYKRLEGTIGKHQVIEMDLIKLDSALKGTYYYKNTNRAVELAGNIDEEGKIVLQELGKFDAINGVYQINAVFKGEFTSEHEIKGNWERMRRDTLLPFSLKEHYTAQSARFEMVKKTKGYGTCEFGNCANFIIIYPLMKSGAMKDKINRAVIATILSQYENRGDKENFIDFDDLMNDFVTRYKVEERNFSKSESVQKPVWEHHNEVQIFFNALHILSLQFSSAIYEGNSRPLTAFHFQNYDMSTGKKIVLEDIFVKDYEVKLTEIAEKIFRTQYGLANAGLREQGFTFPNGKFSLNNNFILNKRGITFQFNPYEIASYTMGAPQIFIPYDQVKHLIKQEGLLRFALTPEKQ